MIAHQIAVVGKKAYENILRIRARFDRIEDLAKTMIQITDLSVISGLHDSRQRWVDCIRPNGVTHEGNLFIQMIFLFVAENDVGHTIWIVHPVEGNWGRKRRMGTDKRYKSKKRP